MKQQSTVASSKFKRANKAGHFRRILYSAEQKFCQRAPTTNLKTCLRVSEPSYIFFDINLCLLHYPPSWRVVSLLQLFLLLINNDGSASQILNLVIFCQSTCCLLLTCSSWPGTNFSLFFTKEKKVESAKNKKLEKHLFLWSWKITAVMVKNLAPMQQKTGSFFLFSSECHSSSYFSCKL